MNVTHQLLCTPLEQILISGGDARSVINETTGLNSFGCAPSPRPEAFSFGSSTASSISNRAFRHVEQERDKFLKLSSQCDVLDEQTEALRSELKQLLGIGQNAAEIVFSPSGTDSTLHALFLTRALSGQVPLDNVVLASEETGSGVPQALSGRHFNTITAAGVPVTKGGAIAGLAENVTLVSLPMRDQAGECKPPTLINQEIFAAVSRSVAAGRHVLLQIMDSSKLGVRCPGLDCLQSIQSQFANSVSIVVDACQMRLSLARLQWHLAQGHLVLISGSKFFTGPPFSGALLVPASLAVQIETVRKVPVGLQDYTGRSDWPRAWRHIRASLPDRANWGQYFRWAAALDEMRAYFAVPLDFRCLVLQQFAKMTSTLINHRQPNLLLLEDTTPPADSIEDAEMSVRTIFPFLLRHGKEWMSFEDATKLYGALNRNLACLLPASLPPEEQTLAAKICHIGQPVSVVRGERKQVGVLRICAGARMVSHIWSKNQVHPSDAPLQSVPLNQEITEISTILDKMALVCRHLDSLTGGAC